MTTFAVLFLCYLKVYNKDRFYFRRSSAARLAVVNGENEEEDVTVFQQTKLPPLFPLEEIQDGRTGDRNHANTRVAAANRRRSKVAAGAQSDMAFSSPLVRS